MSYGEDAVGLKFNPSGDPTVEDLKRRFANIIDALDDHRRLAGHDPEKMRLLSIAITEAQDAQMWAIKAVTWDVPPPPVPNVEPVEAEVVADEEENDSVEG